MTKNMCRETDPTGLGPDAEVIQQIPLREPFFEGRLHEEFNRVNNCSGLCRIGNPSPGAIAVERSGTLV